MISDKGLESIASVDGSAAVAEVYLKEILESIKSGQASVTRVVTEKALKAGVEPDDIVQRGLIAGMDDVGKKFNMNKIYIPEILMASRALHAALYVLKPFMTRAKAMRKEVVVIGTVRGDLHDIGKRLVSIMLEGQGLRVIDIGIDVPKEEFIRAVREVKPQILGMSSLLTTTMPAIPETIKALEFAGLREQVKVIVGGAPVTAKFAQDASADGYAGDAYEAANLVLDLLGPLEACAEPNGTDFIFH